ncbi:hypothetical protein FA15DRAFT_707525 [Coprinopsis marcescibilis]|uniref:Wax synthase domain-containing protein n=1 Tax=Coprinopsis marcescibilis TaxID=230819 RepID=A0A5C3KML9_COPMA|nr:hypothetical protein FA15DRAFT_707525 [Coprinopsis marcescibilis]
MRGAADYSPLCVPIIAGLSVLGYTSRPSPYRWLFFLPIASISVYAVFFTASDDIIGDYSQGCWIATNFFIASDFLVLTDVQRVFRKVGSGWGRSRETAKVVEGEGTALSKGTKGDGQSELYAEQDEPDKIHDQPFLARLKWGFHLFTSPRGMGWAHGLPATRYVLPSVSKLAFFQTQALDLLGCLVLYDLAQIMLDLNPGFRVDGPAFREEQRWWMRPTVLGHTMASVGGVGGSYVVFNCLLVLLGVYEPMQWPFTFGSLLEGYTVRRCWSKVWHRNMVRFMTSHADYFAPHLPPNSRRKQYLTLYTAFFISALIHYAGDYMLLQSYTKALGAFQFFMLQPFIITLETALIAFAKRALGLAGGSSTTAGAGARPEDQKKLGRLPRLMLRLAGYAWTLSWFTYTLPIWIQPHVRAGFFKGGRYESVIGRAAKWGLGL